MDFRCHGKKCFPTFKAAEKAAEAHACHGNDAADGVFRAYACNRCGGFHVGSSMRTRERKPLYIPPIDLSEVSL